MWTPHRESIDRQTVKVTLHEYARALSFEDVLRLWKESDGFRMQFTAAINSWGFDAFFWEMPPITKATLDRPFEFVLVEGEPLARLTPDPSPFSSHFSSRGSQEVLTFSNLGGDAVLVVPAPITKNEAYTHLARFLKHAPDSQVSSFWQSTGLAVEKRLSNAPLWLSTAGMGVSWLHLRLDSRPKYYRHGPYKTRDYLE